VGGMCLKDSFSRPFFICSSKEVKLWQGGVWNNNLEWLGKIGWRRNLFERERNQEQQLVHLMDEKSLKVDKADIWIWKESETKDFTVKSAYKILKRKLRG